MVFGPRPPDTDGDGVDDTLDECPFDSSKTTEGICGCNIPDDDRDNDGVIDCIDNCPDVANAGQEDSDGNNIGNACDPNNGNGNTGGPGPNPFPGDCGTQAMCPAAPAASMAPFAMIGIAMMRSRLSPTPQVRHCDRHGPTR
ncbi:MAG: thrombospondin type 3 repeat-containing protein [Planctomycetes bacterium]|nr:thrombospondin type 3 repeat-containing protein [Planctomycetota bacterium]